MNQINWRKITKAIRLLFPTFLGLLLLWYLYKDTDFGLMYQILSNDVSYLFFGLSLIFGLMANVIRGLRWHLMIKPIAKEDGAYPKRWNAIYTVLGNYTINMVIPRGGEVWRCIAYNKYEKVNFPKLLGTMLNDRIIDVFVLGSMIVAVVGANLSYFQNLIETKLHLEQRFHYLLTSSWLYTLIILGILTFVGLIFLLIKYPNHKLSSFCKNIWSGIISLKSIQKKTVFIIYSYMIWICYFLSLYTVFFAFDFTYQISFSEACIVFILSSLSALAPIQAGIGAWHYMVILSLVSFGVGNSDAGAFAFIVFLIQNLWVTLTGYLAILHLPYINKSYKRLLIKEND